MKHLSRPMNERIVGGSQFVSTSSSCTKVYSVLVSVPSLSAGQLQLHGSKTLPPDCELCQQKCTQAHTLLTKGDFYGVCTQCARTHGVQHSTAWVHPYLFDRRKSFLGEGVLMAFLRAVCLGQ